MSGFRWLAVIPFFMMIGCASDPVHVKSYGGCLTERRTELVGQPRVSWPKGKLFAWDGPGLAVRSGGVDRDIPWRGNVKAARRLDSRKTYRFELLSVYCGRQEDHEDLSRILDGERVVYDAAVCEVHHGVMVREKIPIHYGMQALQFILAKLKSFPHPGWVGGGCIMDRSAPQYTVDWICGECVRAEKEWQEKPVPDDGRPPVY